MIVWAVVWFPFVIVPAPNWFYRKGMPIALLIDIVGATGAALTTLCWLPQAVKVIRDKETRALSLSATAGFTAGIVLWLIYGLAIHDWPLIGSNAATFGTAVSDPRHEAARRLARCYGASTVTSPKLRRAAVIGKEIQQSSV